MTGIDLLEAQAPSPCSGFRRVLYYAVRVAAGATLTVEPSPTSEGYWPSLSLSAGCGGACLAEGSGVTGALTYANHGATQTFIVGVGADAFGDASGPPVTLNARVE